MGKVFNTTAVCIPEKHYMVDITERLNQIKALVDEGKYYLRSTEPDSMERRQRCWH